jgi:hypothetical protein
MVHKISINYFFFSSVTKRFLKLNIDLSLLISENQLVINLAKSENKRAEFKIETQEREKANQVLKVILKEKNEELYDVKKELKFKIKELEQINEQIESLKSEYKTLLEEHLKKQETLKKYQMEQSISVTKFS